MLKALELAGFKSFADKTRFEFPDGITVVVGPNGSGKSNVVDAIKWVLGEQSAKSLRGKEMSDVIFKGSGNGQRKPANTAEATIVFDNSDNRLAVDAQEVHVTRRVYRSGEGEYLVNGQACRLRDVKDLFRGTGVGADAYSLIEQGKVDTLLQASPRDRRAIFEEAAGVSRFKVKKVEAQRRLERVEQNLLRLSDIVDEVDHRLRRLKSQAGKARRYNEYSNRLQELRTHVGRVDWQRLTDELESVQTRLAQQNAEAEQRQSKFSEAEQQYLKLESRLAQAEDALRNRELETAKTREELVAGQATTGHEHEALHQLEEESTRSSRQLLVLCSRAGGLQASLGDAVDEVSAAEAQSGEIVGQRDRRQQALDESLFQLDKLRVEHERRREKYLADVRELAELKSVTASRRTQLTSQRGILERLASKLDGLEADITEADRELDQAETELRTAREAAEKTNQSLEETRRKIEQSTAAIVKIDESLTGKHHRRTAASERAAVLAEIETQLEGVGNGVKECLRRAREDVHGPYAGIRGMVADLFSATDPNVAHLLDAALGERSQLLVMAGQQLVEHLQSEPCDLPGRVGLIRLESSPPNRSGSATDLKGQSGVIGLAADFVEASPEYQHLVSWLLGDTWFVEMWTDAVEFARSIRTPARFVTRNGEVFERDGRLRIGSAETAFGLFSRRAELKTLHEEISTLERDLAELQGQRDEFTATHESLKSTQVQLEGTFRDQTKLVSEATVRGESARRQREELESRHVDVSTEKNLTQSSSDELQLQLGSSDEQLEALARMVAEGQSAIVSNKEVVDRCDMEHQQLLDALTSSQVDVARSEQHYEALATRLDQLRRDQSERRQAIVDAQQQSARCQQRQQQIHLRILRTSSQVNELSVRIEQGNVEVQRLDESRDNVRKERVSIHKTVEQLHQALADIQQQSHVCQLDAERILHERGRLAERIEEAYGIDVSELVSTANLNEDEELARDEVDREITELRETLSNLGSVNMDAVEELEDLEVRFTSLSGQYEDLAQSKEALQKIIHKINADSSRLFIETVDAIRTNFQKLFRKVFGGGQADILMDSDVDILESGVEIVATPPGKQSLGLSLLSGGERALTAVTLLMAIFEYRPSPFCVLDEVDGPLDEANIGRFVEVLDEFLSWTKFIVVTHSKKTMTAAHTLYGVTMQESGVSKKVSVRFDDVSENGEINPDAIRRDEEGKDRGAA